MSIMRNVFAGRELVDRGGFLRMKRMRDTTMEVLDKYVRIAGITSPELMVEELSGGQQQAVAIARAVHFKHDMLLLDEPTSALSVRETEKVLNFMTDLAGSGVSCVFVTHNLYQASQVCHRFVVMAHGRVVKVARKEDTSIEELTEPARHALTAGRGPPPNSGRGSGGRFALRAMPAGRRRSQGCAGPESVGRLRPFRGLSGLANVLIHESRPPRDGFAWERRRPAGLSGHAPVASGSRFARCRRDAGAPGGCAARAVLVGEASRRGQPESPEVVGKGSWRQSCLP